MNENVAIELTLSKQKETTTKRNHVVSLTTQIQTVLESMYVSRKEKLTLNLIKFLLK